MHPSPSFVQYIASSHFSFNLVAQSVAKQRRYQSISTFICSFSVHRHCNLLFSVCIGTKTYLYDMHRHENFPLLVHRHDNLSLRLNIFSWASARYVFSDCFLQIFLTLQPANARQRNSCSCINEPNYQLAVKNSKQ